VNKFIGLLVLCCTVIVGFGSISGCPKKDTTKKSETGTAAQPKDADKVADKVSDKVESKASDKKEGSFVVKVPTDYELEIAKGKGSFDVTAERTNLTGEIKLAFTGFPKGATATYGPILAGKDTSTVEIALDKGEAKAGTYDVNLLATHGEAKQEIKMKVKLK